MLTVMPESIPHCRSWTRARLHQLDLDAGHTHGREGRVDPVVLPSSLPGNHVVVLVVLKYVYKEEYVLYIVYCTCLGR